MRKTLRNLTPIVALAALLSVFAGVSSAAAAVTVTTVTPASGPEFSGIAVTVKGTGFSTTPGATVISFGGAAAKNVACTTTRLCTAVTPYSPEGSANVTATVESSTSTNTVPFAFTVYSPPVVSIVAGRKGPKFSRAKLTDRYPGIFTFGNDYIEITNSTTETQTVSGPSGTTALEAGTTLGENFPINEATPRVYELTTSNSKKTLTVTSKTPK